MIEEKKPKSKKKFNKNIINVAIILVIFVGLTIYMISVDGWDNIVKVISNVKVPWVIMGLICIILYWLIEAFVLYLMTKKLYPNQKFIQSLRVTMIGQLFNSLTPFSSGGQPMQAIAMVNEGKKLSDSMSVLLIKFIVFQVTLVLYTLVVIIFQYTYFNALVSNFINLALIGFVINFLVIVFLFLIGVNEKLVYNSLKPIYKLLGKIKILKNVDEKLEHLKVYITTFHEQFKIIKKEKALILKTTIYTIIQHTVFFLITYMVYKAFGQSGVSVIKIISAQAFLMMIMAFVPIPGAGIAAEGGFLIIFNTFFTSSTINMAILFWRMYTFYLPILVGAFFLFVSNKKKLKN